LFEGDELPAAGTSCQPIFLNPGEGTLCSCISTSRIDFAIKIGSQFFRICFWLRSWSRLQFQIRDPIAHDVLKNLLCRTYSHSVILWKCEGDPLSPPEGEAPQGGKPPWPPVLSFSFRHPFTAWSTKARVDEIPSARGSIADQSMISGRSSHENTPAGFFCTGPLMKP